MNRDLARQLFVTVSALVAVFGVLLGSGLLGERVAESTGGALSDEATLIAPAGPAFSIWSVIYLGLAAYVIWQWLPVNRESTRERAIGWWVGASLLLNASWLFVTQLGLIWLSVAVILALALVLGMCVRNLGRHPDDRLAGRLVVDGTHGLHLGWVTAASCANIAAAGAASGWDPGPTWGPVLAIVVLVVAVLLGGVYQVALGPRLAPALALAWAFSWIAVGRGQGEPPSTPVLVAAVAAAVVTLLLWAALRTRRGLVEQTG